MIIMLYLLGLLAYILTGVLLAKFINKQTTYKEFKDQPLGLGIIVAAWPIVILGAVLIWVVLILCLLFSLLGKLATSK